MRIDRLQQITQEEFVSCYIAQNKPCVISHSNYDAEAWTPEGLRKNVGSLSTQIYDTLFDLQDIDTVDSYLNKHFGRRLNAGESAPYIRWYNQLKDIEFPWGDEAFFRLSKSWTLPEFVPTTGYLVPVCSPGATLDPVVDRFPYRGILIAARGARTRLHRDPFCSDAIVNQFYGVKEFCLFHPRRTRELEKRRENNSFGGFVDVREGMGSGYSIEPDCTGTIGPGEILYIPNGWLHDVLVVDDSVSITWNFVHESGSESYLDYLYTKAASDGEFAVLQYFYELGGHRIEDGVQAREKLHMAY